VDALSGCVAVKLILCREILAEQNSMTALPYVHCNEHRANDRGFDCFRYAMHLSLKWGSANYAETFSSLKRHITMRQILTAAGGRQTCGPD